METQPCVRVRVCACASVRVCMCVSVCYTCIHCEGHFLQIHSRWTHFSEEERQKE